MGMESQALSSALWTLMFVLFGYLSGNILYARAFAALLSKGDIVAVSSDKNPGTANAFKHGGFLCGVLTLCCDLLKGFLPVFLFTRLTPAETVDGAALALVIAAPVVGHVLPVCFRWHGGKGIAASFGCLLGLIPDWSPVLVLAALFIFFSVVVVITPHYQRTLVTYFCAGITMFFVADTLAVSVGFLIISLVIIVKMFSSKEEKEPTGVRLLWMR